MGFLSGLCKSPSRFQYSYNDGSRDDLKQLEIFVFNTVKILLIDPAERGATFPKKVANIDKYYLIINTRVKPLTRPQPKVMVSGNNKKGYPRQPGYPVMN